VNPDIVESQYLGAGDNLLRGVRRQDKIAAGTPTAPMSSTPPPAVQVSTIEAEADKWAIGVDSDQYLTVGDADLQAHILTSMLKRVDVAVFLTAKAVAEGDTSSVPPAFDLSVEASLQLRL
jgi:hypothetical protein